MRPHCLIAFACVQAVLILGLHTADLPADTRTTSTFTLNRAASVTGNGQ